MKAWNVKRIALSGLLIAVMLILGYIESLIPLGPVPGIKLGLSNSVLLLGLCWLGIPATFVLMFAKVLLSGILFSGVGAMLYALAGGILSMLGMSILFRFGSFSKVAIGMTGGLLHNVGQVGLAMLILETDKLVYYMAILMFVGLATGFVTGQIATVLERRLPESVKNTLRGRSSTQK